MYLHSTTGAVVRVPSLKQVLPVVESPAKPQAASAERIRYEPMKVGQDGVQEDDVDYEVVRDTSGEKKEDFYKASSHLNT